VPARGDNGDFQPENVRLDSRTADVMNKTSITVVIPTLNEKENIAALLRHLAGLDEQMDIIVADGDSTDGTGETAASLAAVVQAPRGRGAQMNAGAREARGDVLWFLHADCRPHPDSVKAMRQSLVDGRIVGGAFEYNLDDPTWIFRITEVTSNAKNHLLNLIYGDMGIFVRREVFEKMGGYREIPLMEDMDFCKRLKKQGKIIILPQQIDTSARRWRREGIMKNLIRNTLLQIAWAMGVSPETLARWYAF